ncbi:26311_t:CDS:1, partial [Gigaspora margarita]
WNHVDIKDNESSIYKESEKISENDANLDQNIQDESVSAIYTSSALNQYLTRVFEIDTTNF